MPLIPDKFWNILQGTAKSTGSAGSRIAVATNRGIISGCYCGNQIVAGQKVFLAKASNNQWWVFSSVPTSQQVVRNTKQVFKGQAKQIRVIEAIQNLLFKTSIYSSALAGKSGDELEKNIEDIVLNNNDILSFLTIINKDNKNTNNYILFLKITSNSGQFRYIVYDNGILKANTNFASTASFFKGNSLHREEFEDTTTYTRTITSGYQKEDLLTYSEYFPYNLTEQSLTGSSLISFISTPLGRIGIVNGGGREWIDSSFVYRYESELGSSSVLSGTTTIVPSTSTTINISLTVDSQPFTNKQVTNYKNDIANSSQNYSLPFSREIIGLGANPYQGGYNGSLVVVGTNATVTCIGSGTSSFSCPTYFNERINIISLGLPVHFNLYSQVTNSNFNYTHGLPETTELAQTVNGNGTIDLTIASSSPIGGGSKETIVYESSDGNSSIKLIETIDYDYQIIINNTQSGLSRNTTTNINVEGTGTSHFYLNNIQLNTFNTLYQPVTIVSGVLPETIEPQETVTIVFRISEFFVRATCNRSGNFSFECNQTLTENGVTTPRRASPSMPSLNSLIGNNYTYNCPSLDISGIPVMFGYNQKTYKGTIVSNTKLNTDTFLNIPKRSLVIPHPISIYDITVTFDEVINQRLAKENVLINPDNATAMVCFVPQYLNSFNYGVNLYQKGNGHYITDTPYLTASQANTEMVWYSDLYKFDNIDNCFKYQKTISGKLIPFDTYTTGNIDHLSISCYF